MSGDKNDTYFTGNGTLTLLPPTTTALALTGGSSPANPGASLTFTATVSGEPEAVLLWLWGRRPDDVITLDGDPALLTAYRDRLRIATQ